MTVLGGGGLTIRNVAPSDAGQYTVTVTNEAGSESRLFNVAVLSKLTGSVCFTLHLRQFFSLFRTNLDSSTG